MPVSLCPFVVYCKTYSPDGVHFVKVEADKFTFNWLRETFIKPTKQKVAKALAYDDLSGDRVLLSNEDEFQLMRDTMKEIGANMVKLYVTVTKEKAFPNVAKYTQNRELLRGGSFGVFNAKHLSGFDRRAGKTLNPEKTFSMSLTNAHRAFLNLEHCVPLNVAEINVKWNNGSLEAVCSGKMGYSDFNLLTHGQVLIQLENEPKKCAWIDKEKCEAYVLEFGTKENAREFYEKIKEMVGEKEPSNKTTQI